MRGLASWGKGDTAYPCALPSPGSQATNNPGKNMGLVRTIRAKLADLACFVTYEP